MTETSSGSEVSDVVQMGRGLTWEEMKEGMAFRTSARTITETDLVSFITHMGFTEALFMDERHAKEAGYRGRLVPGSLTFCLAEGLVMQTNAIQGTGIAFMHMDLDVKRPVFVGDTIEVEVRFTRSRPSKKAGRGIVESENTVYNQKGEPVLVYRPLRLIRGRDFVTER